MVKREREEETVETRRLKMDRSRNRERRAISGGEIYKDRKKQT